MTDEIINFFLPQLLQKDEISFSVSSLNFEGVVLPSRQLLLDLTGPRAEAQRLHGLGDEALRWRDAQHHQQLGVATWWRRTRCCFCVYFNVGGTILVCGISQPHEDILGDMSHRL